MRTFMYPNEYEGAIKRHGIAISFYSEKMKKTLSLKKQKEYATEISGHRQIIQDLQNELIEKYPKIKDMTATERYIYLDKKTKEMKEELNVQTVPHYSSGSMARSPKNIRPTVDLVEIESKNKHCKDTTLKIKINLEDMVKAALINNGYEATEFNIEELLDTMDSKKELKSAYTDLIRRHLEQHINYCIGFLNTPEIQNTKDYGYLDGNLDESDYEEFDYNE